MNSSYCLIPALRITLGDERALSHHVHQVVRVLQLRSSHNQGRTASFHLQYQSNQAQKQYQSSISSSN